MPRSSRVILIQDDEVMEGLLKRIDRMYDIKTVGKIRTKWKRFATHGCYKAAAKEDIRTMAQKDSILWWTWHGLKLVTTTLAICFFSQVSSSSSSKRN